MITFTHVTKKYRTNIGLDDVSVHINKGDFVFLVGPSGAGKSTFIKLILKEINADSGSIKVGDWEVTKLSKREIPQLRRRIGTVFQDFKLLPKKTVYENVAFAMEVLHKSHRQIRRQVPQILSLVGISDKANKYPEELSAGEQQRVAIARAIINNPTVLIADEPTGNLDPETATEIMDLLNQINMRGTTVVMVTHAKDIVDRMKKRVIAIEKGRIVRDESGMYSYDASESTESEEPEDIGQDGNRQEEAGDEVQERGRRRKNQPMTKSEERAIQKAKKKAAKINARNAKMAAKAKPEAALEECELPEEICEAAEVSAEEEIAAAEAVSLAEAVCAAEAVCEAEDTCVNENEAESTETAEEASPSADVPSQEAEKEDETDA